MPETQLQNQNQASQQDRLLKVKEQAHRMPSINTNTSLPVHFGEQKDFAPHEISEFLSEFLVTWEITTGCWNDILKQLMW